MQILCEAAEVLDVTWHTDSIRRQYPISRPRSYVLFTYDEYDYFIRLTTLMGININETLYAHDAWAYRAKHQEPFQGIKVPLEYVTKHLRLLILSDYDTLNKQEHFIPNLRKMLTMLGV